MNEAQKKHFRKILKKYNAGKATLEEKRFLESFYELFETEEDFVSPANQEQYSRLSKSIKTEVDQQIDHTQKQASIIKFRPFWLRSAAAVIIIGAVALGEHFLFKMDKSNQHQVARSDFQNIRPGGNKAVLTLADGRKVVLDDARNGQLATQAGVVITKAADGQIVYRISGTGTTGQQKLQNTISTPKGGQYQVILPDNTSVWLNSASSISYPATFSGNERLVSLTGEAYFEVAKNEKMPFKVRSGLQTVEVLGTHFNVNAYPDEPNMQTTLLEGAVKLVSPASAIRIAPGEQGVVLRDGAMLKRRVDVDRELAWKNGLFSFEGQDIRAIMRQISRWYDIEVVYEKDLPEEKYYGEIARSSKLENVFKILELNNLAFRMEGKTVFVSHQSTKQPTDN
jgi:ferric-dicitrate binding protein FerR (iron transport regulator)